MNEAENLRLRYLEPECSESGMKLQLLKLSPPLFPFKSSRFVIEPGGSSPPDNHSVTEMWIVIEGAGELTYDSDLFEITAGDVVYFAPFHTHVVRNHTNALLRVLSFWWESCST